MNLNYNDNNPMSYSTRDAAAASYDMGLRGYMLKVYNYMASALALTGITAWLGANYAPLTNALFMVQNGHMALTGLGWLVTLAPIVFVLMMSFGLNSFGLGALQGMFWAYAGVMGLSLSTILFAYTGASVARAFFITAIVFGSMSMIGYSTKRDLTGMGQFMLMGVLGIVIASLVNVFFMHSTGLDLALSILMVVIFTGLTAYDTQRIKAMYYQAAGYPEMMGKVAIMGALSLYLDFINLFVQMLRFFGDRRN